METLHALMVWQSSLGSCVPGDLLPTAGGVAWLLLGTFLTAALCEAMAGPVLRRFSPEH